MHPENQPLIIITAPSGAGKTSITRHLLKTFSEELDFSVSAATRKARSHEQHGVDYYFISEEAFKQKIQDNEFVEWEMVYEGKYYGTLKAELERIWNRGRVPVLDVDVKGAIHVQQQFPAQSLSLFIQPPSVDELQNRLRSRGTETAESMQARINKAAFELSFHDQFNHTIVNEDLETACRQAERIVGDFLRKKGHGKE